MGVDFYKCCECGRCGSDADDHEHCEACGGFMCGNCLRSGSYVMFCPDCPAACDCNHRVRDGFTRKACGRQECADCECKHECAGRRRLIVLCTDCANAPAPEHTDDDVLAYALGLLGRTRESLEAEMAPPPDTRYKRPCASPVEEDEEEDCSPEEGEIMDKDEADSAQVKAH